MPELAEVEFYRKRWHLAAVGERVARVLTHDKKRLFRGTKPTALQRALTGTTLVDSAARAKQMIFRFRRVVGKSARAKSEVWLGIHLGMSGELFVHPPDFGAGKHDHLVIVTEGTKTRPGHALAFTDPRMFGRVLLHIGHEPPTWWTKIAPAILSPQFTRVAIKEFLDRRRRAPIKAVLLMQEQFPGIGNWMADEILWRAAIHPARPAGGLSSAEVGHLWRECRRVCQLALTAIAGPGRRLPPNLNVNIPDRWLFKHRWKRGGRDPRTKTPLAHATIGGRTTCWSPARQKL